MQVMVIVGQTRGRNMLGSPRLLGSQLHILDCSTLKILRQQQRVNCPKRYGLPSHVPAPRDVSVVKASRNPSSLPPKPASYVSGTPNPTLAALSLMRSS